MHRMTDTWDSAMPSMVKKPVAKRYWRELVRLAREYGRRLKPKEIVEEAKNPKSPLHDYFEWDVREAAQKYWLHQARNLANVVYVEIVDDEGKPVMTNVLVNVKIREKGQISQAYRIHTEALDTPYERAQLVERALNELEGWVEKHWGLYKELRPLAKTIAIEVKLTRKDLFRRPEKAERTRRAEPALLL